MQLRRVHPHRTGSPIRRSTASPTIVRGADTGRARTRAAGAGTARGVARACRAMFADDHAMLRCGHARLRRALRVVPAATAERTAGTRDALRERCGERRAARASSAPPRAPTRAEAFRYWLRLGLHQLRRAGGPDRDHASRARRRAALDLGAALPARAQLLHGAARTRGAAARDLHRLAHAPHLGRHRRGRAVRAAVARAS